MLTAYRRRAVSTPIPGRALAVAAYDELESRTAPFQQLRRPPHRNEVEQLLASADAPLGLAHLIGRLL